jgi:hypothetical protein
VLFKYTITDLPPQLPMRLVPTVRFEEGFLVLELIVESRMIKTERLPVEELSVSFYLPSYCGKPNIAVNWGTFFYDETQSLARWQMGWLDLERQTKLSGKVPVPAEHAKTIEETQLTALVAFSVIPHSVSGTKVEKLLARGETYAPYKGARCIFKSGVVEVRLN